MTAEQIALIVAAILALAYALRQEIPKLAKGWADRTAAERITTETVRGIVATMRADFEKRHAELSDRVATLTNEHRACTQSLADMTKVNEGQERRIVSLESQVAAQAETIAKYERALKSGEAERAELQKVIDGERAEAPSVSVPSHIDVVIRHEKGEES